MWALVLILLYKACVVTTQWQISVEWRA
jgi:hypothetical protein